MPNKYKISADLSRSYGSRLYDSWKHEYVFDLFGMYSSLPLGYSHPAFGVDFQNDILHHASIKFALGEIDCLASTRFKLVFERHPSMTPFRSFHYCCTGALAVEAAVKTALWNRGRGSIAVFSQSFHGINGYGGFLASSSGPAANRLKAFPFGQLARVFDHDAPTDELLAACFNREISAILVEPIQCTAGDVVLPKEFLQFLRKICSETGIPLIFDEIQTGFGGTGTLWYFEQLGFIPDIVIFGKKTQVSGIMVRPGFDQIFNESPESLSVTWDGDVLDMIRATTILRAYEKYHILDNVNERSAQLAQIPELQRIGLLLRVQFETTEIRDSFIGVAWYSHKTMMIPTGARAVRLRPNLAITSDDCDHVLNVLSEVQHLCVA